MAQRYSLCFVSRSTAAEAGPHARLICTVHLYQRSQRARPTWEARSADSRSVCCGALPHARVSGAFSSVYGGMRIGIAAAVRDWVCCRRISVGRSEVKWKAQPSLLIGVCCLLAAAGAVGPGLVRVTLLAICAIFGVAMFIRARRDEDSGSRNSK